MHYGEAPELLEILAQNYASGPTALGAYALGA